MLADHRDDAQLRQEAFAIVSIVILAKEAQALWARPDRHANNNLTVSVSDKRTCTLSHKLTKTGPSGLLLTIVTKPLLVGAAIHIRGSPGGGIASEAIVVRLDQADPRGQDHLHSNQPQVGCGKLHQMRT